MLRCLGSPVLSQARSQIFKSGQYQFVNCKYHEERVANVTEHYETEKTLNVIYTSAFMIDGLRDRNQRANSNNTSWP